MSSLRADSDDVEMPGKITSMFRRACQKDSQSGFCETQNDIKLTGESQDCAPSTSAEILDGSVRPTQLFISDEPKLGTEDNDQSHGSHCDTSNCLTFSPICPVCQKSLSSLSHSEVLMNSHVEECLNRRTAAEIFASDRAQSLSSSASG